MPVHTKRWDDPIDAADGTRILVSRYRPRALAKSLETWSEWLPDLAPSKELHAAAYGKGVLMINWDVYRARYLAEMRGAESRLLITQLAERVRGDETITLLCSSQCVRETRCHRSLLKTLIERELERMLTETVV